MYELLARYYDQIHAPLTADLPFVLQLAQENGGPVLDLGCGTGRLLLPLAEAGYQVTGVDNSPQMLKIAGDRLAAKPPDVRELVTLWEKDIRNLAQEQITTKYSLALLSYNTLLHIPEGEIGSLLNGIAGMLRSGGQLLIDLENPFLLTEAAFPKESVFETSFIDEVSNQRVEQWSQSSLDIYDQTLTVSWQFRAQDTEEEPALMKVVYHYFYPHQIIMRLQQAGFRLEKVVGNYQKEPFWEESERLILLASLQG